MRVSLGTDICPCILTQGRIFRKILLPSFTQKQVVLRQKPSCVWTKKWPKIYEGAELAQNRG